MFATWPREKIYECFFEKAMRFLLSVMSVFLKKQIRFLLCVVSFSRQARETNCVFQATWKRTTSMF